MADYIWTRTRRYNELVAKYENRESRQEDLDLQAELERRLREAEAEVSKVQEEMKYFKLELQNREQNFNKTFGASLETHARLIFAYIFAARTDGRYPHQITPSLTSS